MSAGSRIAQGLIGLLLPLALAVSPSGYCDDGLAETQARVDKLLHLADPQADDWQSEIDADRAKQVLKKLMHLIAQPGGLDSPEFGAYFVNDATVDDLRPTAGQSYKIGDQQVYRYSPASSDAKSISPRRAFEALLASHGASTIDLHAKIIAVQKTASNEFVTNALVEASSAALCEQTATWTIGWCYSDERKALKIKSIKLVTMTEVHSPQKQFTDCTGGVIRSADWNEHLSKGAYWWYGRTDALGGFSFNGHHGIAVGDISGDGLDDLYVCTHNGIPNKLFIQRPDGTVREAAYSARVPWLDQTASALILDMDNDGDQDLVCAIGPSIVLSLNDGTGTLFWKASFKHPSRESIYSIASADFDSDGDLDIYATRYAKKQYFAGGPTPYHDANNGPTNFLLRNDDAQKLTDVTDEVGLNINNARFSFAASWIDYDNDSDMDLYVSNDFGRNNLYRNEGGRFVDVAFKANAEDQASGMGTSWSDFDGDGDFDLLISNMFSSAGRRVTYQSRAIQDIDSATAIGLQRHSLGNTLLVNEGNGRFVDQSDHAGIRMGRWAWGGKFIDINNDGFEDMVVPNGWLTNDTEDDL